MNDTVTILGRVGADPKRSETTNGVAVVNFRVASPQRRFDSKTQTWTETGTKPLYAQSQINTRPEGS